MREQQPDVVILDLHLETPDAADRLLDLMAVDPATQRIPTIICSGDGAALRNRMKHWRRPAYAMLAKPFQIDELMALVQSAIAGDAECASSQR